MIWRYLKLYKNFVRFSCSQTLMFQVDFWLRIVMDLVYYGTMLGLYQVLFLHTDHLGGFSKEQAFVFLDALQMTIFANGTFALGPSIRSGELDYYLVRPVSTLFFVTLRDFSMSSLINLFFAAAILIGALHQYSGTIAWWQYIYGTALLLNGVFLFYIFRILSALPSFWTVSSRGTQNAFYVLREIGERPDKIYSGVVRAAFMTVLPFCLMASIPTRAFFEPFQAETLALIVMVTATSFCLMLWFWKKGLNAYGSASS